MGAHPRNQGQRVLRATPTTSPRVHLALRQVDAGNIMAFMVCAHENIAAGRMISLTLLETTANDSHMLFGTMPLTTR